MRSDLEALQNSIDREFPLCVAMGMQVYDQDEQGLVLRAPLELNLYGHMGFAGSLNNLCTVAGWGTVFLYLHSNQIPGSIVLRRGVIEYRQPVDSREIVARCYPIHEQQLSHFCRMYERMGQAKLDLDVEIHNAQEVAVFFHGSYAVLRDE